MSRSLGPQDKPTRLPRFSFLVKRMAGSAVIWSWGMSGLRLGSGVLLLPLLVMLLSKEDLGFYYLLLSFLAIVPIVDLGLGFAIERSLSYAMGGARELKAHGLNTEQPGDGRPNQELLWRIVHAAKVYYSVLALAGFVVLGLAGTWVVSKIAGQTSNPTLTWLSWGIAAANTAFEIYSGWWNVVLRGVNGMVASARILFACHALKLVLACALLLAGAGLPSVFVAGVVSSFLIRWLSRRAALSLLPPSTGPVPSRAEILALLRVLWPNSWRVGLQLFGNIATTILVGLICSNTLGLAAYQEYALSVQIATMVQGIAEVWVSVKWPMVGQLRARHDHQALRRLLRPRAWLQAGTFVVLAAAAVGLGPWLLRWIGTDKQLMPYPWLLLIFIHAFLFLQVAFWTSLLATENRVPSLWPMMLTNVVNLSLILTLTHTTSFGLAVFALAPVLANLMFNYWYWPMSGARNLQTTWLKFVLPL